MPKTIEVKVTANAKERSCRIGPDGVWLVRTPKPRDGGKANAHVIAIVAEHLGIAKSLVEISSGHAGTRKKIRIG